ncbi:hypothetical protein D3C80_1681000 [compost metagenome]
MFFKYRKGSAVVNPISSIPSCGAASLISAFSFSHLEAGGAYADGALMFISAFSFIEHDSAGLAGAVYSAFSLDRGHQIYAAFPTI